MDSKYPTADTKAPVAAAAVITPNNTNPTTDDRMKSVKAAWDKAPSGPKKDAALKHYQAAEKAKTAKNDEECRRELEAATHALA